MEIDTLLPAVSSNSYNLVLDFAIQIKKDQKQDTTTTPSPPVNFEIFFP